MSKKIALVTGANRGLGLEVSRQLGDAGYTVLLGCRNEQKAESAEKLLQRENLDAHWLRLDVTSDTSIASCCHTVAERFGCLDVLINNAAIHYDFWEDATAPNWSIVSEAFESNCVGAWKMAVACLPLLRRSAHPRIVNVSSEAGSLASMSGGAPAYSLSKAGLNATTRMLAAKLTSDRILVNSVCPGWVATEMGGAGGRSVQEGAKGIVWAATLEDDGPSGGFFRDGRPLSF